jgi:hypothetical protein
MSSIIKKGTNACSFRLDNGKLITLEPDILVVLDESTFNQLMGEYGSFIIPRIISDSNPRGCFIVNRKSDYAKDMNKEVGEVKDNSSRIEVSEGEVKPKRGRRKKQ